MNLLAALSLLLQAAEPPSRTIHARPEPSLPFDIQHYRLRLYVDIDDRAIYGVETVRLAARSPGLREAALHAVDLDIPRVEGPSVSGFECADGALIVRFSEEIPPATPFELTIPYSGRPRHGIFFVQPSPDDPSRRRQAWTQGEPEQARRWHPCYDYPNERATTEVLVLVPEGQIALAAGALAERRPARPEDWEGLPLPRGPPDGTFDLWHFRMDFPHVAYLTTLIVGEFDSWTTDWEGVSVEAYLPAGNYAQEDFARTFGLTPRMLDLFSRKTGVRYPYPKYAQTGVTDFIWGGMENISATTLNGDRLVHDAEVHPERNAEGLIAHELAHQWFGDYVTCRNWQNIWLNEGFATYYALVWFRDSAGEDEFRYRLLGTHEGFLNASRSSPRSIVAAGYNDPEDVFDAHSYPGGGSVLHVLESLVGIERFDATIARYLRECGRTCVVTEDLQRAFESETRESWQTFFDEWLRRPGTPRYGVRYLNDDPPGSLTIVVSQEEPIFHTPLPVRVHHREAAAEDVSLAFEGAESRATVLQDGAWVEIDPMGTIPKTLTVEGDGFWTQQLTGGSSVYTRVEAARRVRDRDALAAAFRQEPFYGVRKEIVDRFPAGDESKAFLLEALADAHPEVRRAAIGKLDAHRGADVREALTRLYDGDPSLLTRAAAATAIGAFGDEGQAWVLARLEPGIHVEIAAGLLAGVRSTAGAEALDRVAPFAAAGTALSVRVAAIEALSRLTRHDRDRVEEIVLARIGDGAPQARQAVVRFLGQHGTARAIEPLERLAEREADVRFRGAVVEALESVRRRAGGDRP